MSRLSETIGSRARSTPAAALDADAVRAAYRRWASIYDTVFGGVSSFGRRRAAAAANRLPGHQVLEVGVGTGLALPIYAPGKRITGIDLSSEMLTLARKRVVDEDLSNVDALLEMDAEATDFEDGAFDIAVAMFVASVVPVRQSLRCDQRSALVDRAGDGSGLPRPGLASGLRHGGAVPAGRPHPAHQRKRAAVRHLHPGARAELTDAAPLQTVLPYLPANPTHDAKVTFNRSPSHGGGP